MTATPTDPSAVEFGMDTFGDITVDADGTRLHPAQVMRNVVEEGVLADRVQPLAEAVGLVVGDPEPLVVAQDQVAVARLDVEHALGTESLVVGVGVLLDVGVGEIEAVRSGPHGRMVRLGGRN